jgi:hypothetical protein
VKSAMHDVDGTAALIRAGKRLLLAGDEGLLEKLPRGTWIGGTIPYFMTEQGGAHTKEKIYITELPPEITSVDIRAYDERTISQVYQRDGGLSFIVIPGLSKMHQTFAMNAPTFPGFASHPLVGWITGIDVPDIGKVAPRVYNGSTGESFTDGAVVMHASFAPNLGVEVDIINLFSQGGGDSIHFETDGFSARDAVVNGKRQPFAQYLKERNVDTKLPLVADFAGAMINTSFREVDESSGVVSFYAPVFAGVEYRLGQAEGGDYISGFRNMISGRNEQGLLFSCNCILNYLYAGLEGKRTGNITGPVTFGEIAYQLLNQTLVYVRILKTDPPRSVQ